ncbi:hypothetical protein PDE_07761 [Penicillium oxalicum 114-2]|uniref:Uncharacterized protein n=1 Tax=Penicillium oxalicum (strain 114-2 / CGMCC 5302) TaxID=933388 RepID=S7ZVN2_PENO1|nr:hypothetical protein PDE_07761 [Penicillium oxalicum 114-2]
MVVSFYGMAQAWNNRKR